MSICGRHIGWATGAKMPHKTSEYATEYIEDHIAWATELWVGD